jgi:tRNA G18 (ribose-2'-O)-methylase SpoU
LPKLPLSIVCDNFHYAWNVGSVFRIADALRVERVYFCGITAFPPHFEIERTDGHAYKWVSWERRESTAEAVGELRERGVQVVAAELAQGGMALNLHEWRAPAAIVLGSEISGVQPCVLRLCDAVVELPMFGMRNSLNVSSTAAVLAYDFLFRACDGAIPDGDTV